tara:strand:+ start:4487 stop:5173 length:687 start_codon:yes stop_codon:yes gene_type:complete
MYTTYADGTISQASLIEASRRARFTFGMAHLANAAGFKKHIDVRTCGGSEFAHYHQPPSGFRPLGGPPNVTRFDAAMAGAGLGPGSTIGADELERIGEWLDTNPTAEVQEQIKRQREMRVDGFAWELSIGTAVVNMADPDADPPTVTYEEFRSFYIDGRFPERGFQEVGPLTGLQFWGVRRYLALLTTKWYERTARYNERPRFELLSNSAAIARNYLEGLTRDWLGLL